MLEVKVLPEQISTLHCMPVNTKKNSDMLATLQLLACLGGIVSYPTPLGDY